MRKFKKYKKEMRVFLLFSFFFLAGFSDLSSKEYNKIGKAYSSYLKGLLSERYGDNVHSLREYLKIRQFDKESTSVKLKIATQYIKLKKMRKALKVLNELREEEPINVEAYLLLILLYSNQKKEAEADRVYGEMLSRLYDKEPENVKVAENLAQYRFQKGEVKEAIQIYKKIVEIKPEYDNGYFWLGYLYESEGETQLAIENWRKVLEINPFHADALNSLGYIYAEEGINLDEAEGLVKKALEIKPESPAYLDSLGWIYFKKGEYLKAKELIERAADSLKDPEILDHLGEVYYKLGFWEEAIEAWQDVLYLEPQLEKVKIKLKKLKNEIRTRKD